MTFTTLGLSEPILKAALEQGYTTPTPIQEQAIPVVLRGVDLLASAQTGTGKTASFMLPLLHRLSTKPRASANHVRVLVLAPTRELAAQIHDSAIQYSQYLTVRSAVVFGGVKINPQMQKLRGGTEILVATPGRLMDLFQQRAVRLDEVETLVLDEADRMLDMGFIHDIKRIMSYLPKKRQTLLFSATFSSEICQLAKEFLKNPVDKARKADLLSHLIRTKDWSQALVFSRTKHGANKLVKLLALDGIDSVAIHGNKSQGQRTKALADFKSGKLHVLVATDIAARGIDIDQLPIVINFDLPDVAEDYVHRIGRTGRAGSVGGAISLVSADEIKQLLDIEKLIKRRLDRIEIDDFEPKHSLPTSASAATFNSRARPQRKPHGSAIRGDQTKSQGRTGAAKDSRVRRPQNTRARSANA